MAENDYWRRRPLLDEKAWSLLPNLGLRPPQTWLAQFIWLALTLMAFVAGRKWPECVLEWVVGAWTLFYIGRRLGGKPAPWPGVGPPIDSDSMFQLRLLGDVMHLLLLVAAAFELALGADAVRRLISELWR